MKISQEGWRLSTQFGQVSLNILTPRLLLLSLLWISWHRICRWFWQSTDGNKLNRSRLGPRDYGPLAALPLPSCPQITPSHAAPLLPPRPSANLDPIATPGLCQPLTPCQTPYPPRAPTHDLRPHLFIDTRQCSCDTPMQRASEKDGYLQFTLLVRTKVRRTRIQECRAMSLRHCKACGKDSDRVNVHLSPRRKLVWSRWATKPEIPQKSSKKWSSGPLRLGVHEVDTPCRED